MNMLRLRLKVLNSFVAIVSLVVTHAQDEPLSLKIERFLTDDTVRIGEVLPFAIDGREDEVRTILLKKVNESDKGLEFMQLKKIAYAIKDSDLEKLITKKAVESILEKPLDPLSESLIIDEFNLLASEEDLSLLKQVIASPNLQLDAAKKHLSVTINKLEDPLNPLEVNDQVIDAPDGQWAGAGRGHALNSKESDTKSIQVDEFAKKDSTFTTRKTIWFILALFILVACILVYVLRKK